MSGGDRDGAPGAPASEPPETADADALPGGRPAPMDFNLFVLSLNASALMHLGDRATADGHGEPAVNLPLARQTIDMIALLEEKTRGNLTGEEDRLIHQVLFDLRMRFTNVAEGLDGTQKDSG